MSVQTSEARELLVKLVRIPSVSGNERPCARQLASFFERHDRDVWLDEVGNVRAPAEDGVLLTSHIDTVPGDIPVHVEADEQGRDVLWGRGSVDATGSLAAMAVAAVQTGMSFVGVVDDVATPPGVATSSRAASGAPTRS
jgi:LysW-gamma-L-lysine carboxypeptidase